MKKLFIILIIMGSIFSFIYANAVEAETCSCFVQGFFDSEAIYWGTANNDCANPTAGLALVVVYAFGVEVNEYYTNSQNAPGMCRT